MDKDKRKIEEPFDPERTPEPAQVMHPTSRGQEERKPDASADDKSSEKNAPESGEKPPKGTKTLLNEGTDIKDETTI